MKTVLITGASRGIGLALTKLWLEKGYHVIGLSRRPPKDKIVLDHPSFTPLLVDLIDSSEVVDLLHEVPLLDGLILNAGDNLVGSFLKSPKADVERLIQLNLVTPILLTQAALKLGKLNPGARLVFVSSLSHFTSYPGAAIYAGTKDGLSSFARSLRVSQAHRLMVTTVFPGPVRTDHARTHSPNPDSEKWRQDPDQLARQIWQASQSGKARLIPKFGQKIIAVLATVYPTLVESLMERTLYREIRGTKV